MDNTTAVLDQMSTNEKHKLFAAIAREFVGTHGPNMIPVADDGSMIGFFVPVGSKAEVISPQENSLYLDEIRERAKHPEQSISLDEFLNRLDAEEEV